MCVINSIATEAAEDAAKLKANLVQLQGSSKSAEEIKRELESSVALCENALRKIHKEREQLEMQLQSKTEEVTKLTEELKLFKQAGVCVCACMRACVRACVYTCVRIYLSLHST